MDPDKIIGLGFLGAALSYAGLLHNDGLTPEERKSVREAQAARRAEEIAAKRAASPEVAAAEAKRKRKAEKLRQIEAKPTT